MTRFPPDYEQRVYSGWLGKCIGVRFGAPLEGWTYDEIARNVGELAGYLRDREDKLFGPDDDTSMPLILIRALEDHGPDPKLSATQIGQTWLNYLGDGHGTIWWGGYGVSSEHTAYVNLANGIPAPRSGSIAQNGAALAEQIGGQIFSDIWGLVAPDNPELASALAEAASSVSHDRNGIYGGRFIAAMVSRAFTESDPAELVEAGLRQIPAECEYARVIRAVRDFHRRHQDDWRACYAFIRDNFGYDKYPGPVNIIPNAGVVAMALLYGGGDFSRAIRIANMAGWDTDCNAGNVGAIMGVAVGPEGIGEEWRAPINDLLIASGIIGTRNLITIPQCADLFCHLAYDMAGLEWEPRPRCHFRYPGSTCNFRASGERGRAIELRNSGNGTLKAAIRKLRRKGEIRIYTRTYYHVDELASNYYGAEFTPLIFPGQRVTAQVYLPDGAPDSVVAAIYVRDGATGRLHKANGTPLRPGSWHDLTFRVPPIENPLLSEVGITLSNLGPLWDAGAIHIGSLDWDGDPEYSIDFSREQPGRGPAPGWSHLRGYWRLEDGAYHGSGPGLCESYTGDVRWRDYALEITLIPITGQYHNVNVRVQGAMRSYAFGLAPEGRIALYKNEGGYHQVASAAFPWRHGESYTLTVKAKGTRLTAWASGPEGKSSLEWADLGARPYLNGQIGLSTWHGSHTEFRSVFICPA